MSISEPVNSPDPDSTGWSRPVPPRFAMSSVPADLLRQMYAAEPAKTGQAPAGCPPWCDRDTIHSWERTDGVEIELSRTHRRPIGAAVELWLNESADPHQRTVINVDEVLDCSAAQARRLAGDLLRAADLLDGHTR